MIIPLIGFHNNYRLGYGGGYFDRTLAARVPKPIAIGIGYELCRLPDFTPLPHDIPMDFIVTDRMIIPVNGRTRSRHRVSGGHSPIVMPGPQLSGNVFVAAASVIW